MTTRRQAAKDQKFAAKVAKQAEAVAEATKDQGVQSKVKAPKKS